MIKKLLKKILGGEKKNNYYKQKNLSIKKNVSIGSNVCFYKTAPIDIGEHTMIAQNVIIYTSTHDYSNHPMWIERIDRPVKIGKHAWIGVGAIIYGDLSQDRIHNIIFDWDKILNFQGESGPYIQYSIVRINSILKKIKLDKKVDYSLISGEQEKNIIKLLSNFNSVLNEALNQNKPHHIAKYALVLSQAFNDYYVKNKIIQEDKKLMNSRVALITSIKTILETSLDLLGIKCPEEM